MANQSELGDLTWRAKIAWGLSGAAIFFLFAFASQPSRGILAAGAFAVLAGLIRAKWELRRLRWFQVFIVVTALIHAVAILYFDGAIDIHPTILIAPFFLFDLVLLLLVLMVLERRLPS